MSQVLAPLQRRRFSLSVRISMGFVLAAIIPLFVTLAVSEWESRPMLITQATIAMESDATTRVQLIDTYFNERILDALTVAQIPAVQTFLAGDQTQAIPAKYILAAGQFRDKRFYKTWALYDPQGNLRLYYPSSPPTHGQSYISTEDMQRVLAGKTFISAVYYDPATKKAFVDLYTPVLAPSTHKVLGLVQAMLSIDYIWDIVSRDSGANGKGSYAFILDDTGVRIADTISSQLFTAVAPLAPSIQDSISKEARYGTSASTPVLADSVLAGRIHNTDSSSAFQTVPAGQSDTFQIAQHTTSVVPWTYFALSPMSTVTAVADQQLLVTALIAFIMFIVAASFGLIVGRRVTYPILHAVEDLRNNSQALSVLATGQKDAAAEQTWVVDASQVGLQSVVYYAEAIQVAAQTASEAGKELLQQWSHADAQTARQSVERLIAAAQYIENATQYQRTSSQKVVMALKLAIQVTEQLSTGATSATDAATQLEQVVKQLRSVVGK